MKRKKMLQKDNEHSSTNATKSRRYSEICAKINNSFSRSRHFDPNYARSNIKIALVVYKGLFLETMIAKLTQPKKRLSMTDQLRIALRAIVLPSPDVTSQESPTRRLLGGLGHDVTRAESPDHAIDLLNRDHTDLLVVDVSNGNENRQMLSRITELADSQIPTQVAIFTDTLDSQLNSMKKNLHGSKVHVFLKPLHMHGLLSVLRQMNKDQHHHASASA
jgi:CheY-like chemotaxis protein